MKTDALKLLLVTILLANTPTPMLAAEPTGTAANAINALGIDLLQKLAKPEANALLSPYSIQSVLAMTYAGAAGNTRTEMAGVLHYPKDPAGVHHSFGALRRALEDVEQASAKHAEQMKKWGATNDPIALLVANRLFGQAGYDFREPFLVLVRDNYDTPFEALDFAKNPASATQHINAWVEDQTRQRIRNLIPGGALDNLTRLVLVNAIYLKAPWADEFYESATKPLPFHLTGGELVNVPTMMGGRRVGYSQRDGFTAVTIPYGAGELQFLVLMPDQVNGLAGLERKLTAKLLDECSKPEGRQIIIYLPKFKIEPPLMPLGKALQALGMKNAFDLPPGSANFDGIAPRRREEYLYISDVFHKTFLNLDEKGTEAAAATAVAMRAASAVSARPVEVHLDHPFLFAIQHRQSGACLFLGRVTDPR
jgi:serpin B